MQSEEAIEYSIEDFCNDFLPNEDWDDDEWLPSWASGLE